MFSPKFNLDNVADIILSTRSCLSYTNIGNHDRKSLKSSFRYEIHYTKSYDFDNTLDDDILYNSSKNNNSNSKLMNLIQQRSKVKLDLLYKKLNLKLGLGSGKRTIIVESIHSPPKLLNCKIGEVAIKDFKRKDWNQLCGHIYSSTVTTHPNILSTLDLVREGDYYAIITEYCKKDLIEVIKFNPLTINTILSYMRQCLLGLNELHLYNIAHQNIKLENIYLGLDNELKFTNFDFAMTPLNSNFIQKDSYLSSTLPQFGTPYLAPEYYIQNKSQCPFKADIWSLGIIFFALAKGSFPWAPLHFNDKFYSHFKKVGPTRFLKHFDIDSRIINILEKMLIFDPEKRWTTKDLLLLF